MQRNSSLLPTFVSCSSLNDNADSMATFVILWVRCHSIQGCPGLYFHPPDVTNRDWATFTSRNVPHSSTFNLWMFHQEKYEKMTQPCSQWWPQIHATSSSAQSLQSFSLSLVSPCSRGWLAVQKTSFSFPPGHISRLYVPISPAVKCGHVTEFWPIEYEWKWSKSPPGLYHKTLSCSILYSLSSCSGWMERTPKT